MDLPVQRALDILSRLGSSPATSFYEQGVASVVRSVLQEINVDYQLDDFGNIVARLPGESPAGASGPLPAIAFVAHMDHPGYEAIAAKGDLLIGKALGGVPPSSFEPGVPLRIIWPDGRTVQAVTEGRHGADEDREVLLRLLEPQPIELPRPVVFDLVDFQLDGAFIRMRALDDLAGCGSILAALSVLKDEGAPGDVYGVFTRAEEVGLVGARLMGESRTLPQNTLVVSLEASRTLPGAEMGSGPVIRVGDAASTFSADAEATLIKARERLQSRPEGFKVQRQLMSGGTCEASAFAMCGYQTTGIAFPLGNYHNGAPQGRIEAEYIHQEDYVGGITLMVEAARGVPERNDTAFRRRLSEVPEDLRQRLQRS